MGVINHILIMEHTLCFLPLLTAVQTIMCLRNLLSIMFIFWLLLSTPLLIIPTTGGYFLNLLLPSFSPSHVLLPIFSFELVVNTLVLVGMRLSNKYFIIPWIAFNTLFLLSPMVVLLFITMFHDVNEIQISDLHNIYKWLRTVILSILIILQSINMSAVIRLLLDMRIRRRVSFSKKVQKKEISRNSSYVDTCSDFQLQQMQRHSIVMLDMKTLVDS